MFNQTLPSIKISKKIYIPMVDTMITLDNLNTLPKYDYNEEEKKPDGNESKVGKAVVTTTRPFTKKHYLSEENKNEEANPRK